MAYSDFKKHYQIHLNHQQEAAVQATEGAILLLAVPGSGKTTVLVSRLGYMIFERGIAPEQILTVTYTVAAARDMKNRFERMFGEGNLCANVNGRANNIPGNADSRTSGLPGYADSCTNGLPGYADSRTNGLPGYADGCEDHLSGQTATAAGQIRTPLFCTINSLSQRILNYYGRTAGKTPYGVIANAEKLQLIRAAYKAVNQGYATEGEIKQLETAITFVKNMRFSRNEIEEYETEAEHFPDIYELYQRGLKSRGQIDFDDQTIYAMKILERFPEILAHFQNQYRYFCVDEAQDTSKLQHAMIRLLAAKSGNLFMVGDEDQSIYGFRAAWPEALTSFDSVWPDSRVLLMETNYRSREEIVTAADRLIRANRRRRRKHMRVDRPDGGQVRQIEMKDRKSQFSYLLKVANDCKTETAVLYRNNESALPLIDLLERNRILYRMKGNDMTFFTHPVVTDICAFIRLALNPCDKEAFGRIYYKMGAGISKANAQAAIAGNNGTEPLLDTLARLKELPDYVAKRCRLLAKHFENMPLDTAGNALWRILGPMGYRAYLNERQMDTGKADILQMLAEQEKHLEDFLPRLDYLRERISAGTQEHGARFILSTIHSSKGLEYDTVYLLDMLEGILPSLPDPGKRNRDTPEAALYEEERRLYYVGMTRAKNTLAIFTFGKGDTSAFSRAVFRPQQQRNTSVRIASAREPGKTPARNSGNTPDSTLLRSPSLLQKKAAQTAVQEKQPVNLDDYAEGVPVFHRIYGEGVIAQRDGNHAEIFFFDMNNTKKLKLDYAVEQRLLRLG